MDIIPKYVSVRKGVKSVTKNPGFWRVVYYDGYVADFRMRTMKRA